MLTKTTSAIKEETLLYILFQIIKFIFALLLSYNKGDVLDDIGDVFGDTGV